MAALTYDYGSDDEVFRADADDDGGDAAGVEAERSMPTGERRRS